MSQDEKAAEASRRGGCDFERMRNGSDLRLRVACDEHGVPQTLTMLSLTRARRLGDLRVVPFGVNESWRRRDESGDTLNEGEPWTEVDEAIDRAYPDQPDAQTFDSDSCSLLDIVGRRSVEYSYREREGDRISIVNSFESQSLGDNVDCQTVTISCHRHSFDTDRGIALVFAGGKLSQCRSRDGKQTLVADFLDGERMLITLHSNKNGRVETMYCEYRDGQFVEGRSFCYEPTSMFGGNQRYASANPDLRRAIHCEPDAARDFRENFLFG